MTKEELSARFAREMQDVRVSPQLKDAALQRIRQSKEPVMKKKISLALVCALVLISLTAAALAATHFGILDFAKSRYGVYVPEDAQNYVQSDVLHMENELVAVDIRELYYDGIIARMAVDVTPKVDKTMLLGEDVSMDDLWISMTPMAIESDKTYTETVRDVYEDGKYDIAFSVCPRLITGDGYLLGSGNYTLNEDGTLTLYLEKKYEKDLPEREAAFRLTLFPFAEDLQSVDIGSRIDLEQPLTLSEAAYGTQTYESTQPVDFPQAGVRVDKLTLKVRAQEIHATIDYTVTDESSFISFENVPWFEFVDPESAQAEAYFQQLSEGLMNGGNVSAVGTGADGLNHFRQTQTLGRNEVHGSYTLRAVSPHTHECLETQTIPVEPAK